MVIDLRGGCQCPAGARGAEKIDASISAIGGVIGQASSGFQIRDCDALAFKPTLAMRLTGKGQQTRDGKHPGLKATLRQGKGEANLDRVKVSLPLSLTLDADNAQALCKPEEAGRP